MTENNEEINEEKLPLEETNEKLEETDEKLEETDEKLPLEETDEETDEEKLPLEQEEKKEDFKKEDFKIPENVDKEIWDKSVDIVMEYKDKPVEMLEKLANNHTEEITKQNEQYEREVYNGIVKDFKEDLKSDRYGGHNQEQIKTLIKLGANKLGLSDSDLLKNKFLLANKELNHALYLAGIKLSEASGIGGTKNQSEPNSSEETAKNFYSKT